MSLHLAQSPVATADVTKCGTEGLGKRLGQTGRWRWAGRVQSWYAGKRSVQAEDQNSHQSGYVQYVQLCTI